MEKTNYYKKFDQSYYTSDGYDDYLDRFLVEAQTVIIPVILRKIKPKKNWKFLDVGCSLGGNIMALEEKGFHAQGTEISEYCLKSLIRFNSLAFRRETLVSKYCN